jgi:molybdopterin/thiamine biosynthesis adenylyltransferase
MAWVLLLAAGLLVLGRVMKVSAAAQTVVMAILFGAVLAIQLTLPEGNALRAATGGSAANWLILGGVVALVLGYRAGLGRLRRRAAGKAGGGAAAPAATGAGGPFTATELDRYARHIVLREVGGPGQKKLKAAKVLVVGAGGLGSPALLYLAAAGAGRIGVIDDDTVSLSNLQRQVIHSDERLGMPKVFSAEMTMKAVNPHVELCPYNRRLEESFAAELFAEYDLVLDGSDNFATRFMVNRAAVAAGVPLLAAAITQWEGQISLYDPRRGAPCYQCVFPEAPADGLAPSCAEAGVIGALPGVMGAMMAMEAIKEITGAGEGLAGRLFIYDGLYGESRTLVLHRRAECPVCGGGPRGGAAPA